MIWRALGWGAIVAIAVAISWLWPRIERVPTDFEIAVEHLDNQRPGLGTSVLQGGNVARRLQPTGQNGMRRHCANSPPRSRCSACTIRAIVMPICAIGPTPSRRTKGFCGSTRTIWMRATIWRWCKNCPSRKKSLWKPEDAPEQVPPETEEHHITEPQEGESNRTQAAESPESETAGNTNDTDEVSDSEIAERPKPVDTTGDVGSATAIGRSSEDRGRRDHRVVGTVDLKPRTSTRPAEVLLRRIHDDPKKVLRARMLSVYEARIARPIE